MNKIVITLLYLALLVMLGSCKKDDTNSNVYDNAILDGVNSYRMSKGLLPFEKNDYMWSLAYDHSKAMADGSILFGHDGSTERYALIRQELGNGTTAENIDWGVGSAGEVVARWLESAGHKENLDGDFTLSAVSAVKSKDGKYYYTQLFYKKN